LKTGFYQPRFYRDWVRDTDLVSFNAVVKETDLWIRTRRNLRSKAFKSIIRHRGPLEKYIAGHPVFLTTLEPYPVGEDAPEMVRGMAQAAAAVGVGPMAAVAGAIAEEVGKDLLEFSPEVIVENGGDIFMKVTKERLVGVYAGDSPFTGKIAVRIHPEDTPVGVATSSGVVGHSLSFGKADAAVVLASSAYLADAAATALGNRVKSREDIAPALEWAQGVPGLLGVLVIKGAEMGLWGKVELVSLL
jgi:ApbE superfamily uncharacterized protein (UPF0280 family)